MLTENATRTDRSNKIHILALGDPAQFTKEREELTFVGGNLNSDTKDTSPLSVVYRTSVSSIVDMVMTFKDKPYNISSINPTASHTAADLLTQENIDNFYGVNGGSEASLIELLNKPSGKSRLLIVNNQQEVERFRKLVPNSVKILTYYDAQSTQADQAFIYLTQRLPDIDGNNISDALMNKFMYTMIGRAKQSVFIANPELRVENPIINPDLAQSKSSLEEDINFNLKQYQGGKKIHGRMIEVLYPNEEIKRSPKKNAAGTKPESTIVADESIDGIGGQEVEMDENSGETLEQKLIEPKPVATEVNETETESGMEVTFEHSFMFPTNRFPNSQFGSLAASVPPGSELRLVVVSTPSSKFPFRIDAVAQTVNGNWVNVAVLSGEELSSSPQMSEILAKASEVSSRISNLPLHADGFAWKPEYDAATVAFGTTQSAASVQYQYIPVGEDGTSMEEALEIFYEGFYKNAKAGEGVEPKVPLHNAKDGKVNWAALAKYVKFHIFSANDIRNLDNTRFLPKLGVPYMIIEEPTEAGVAKAEPQYIRFEPRKLLPSDQLHVTLSKTLDLVGQLGALDPRFAFGKEEFTQLIGHYKDNAVTAAAEGPQRNETSALEVLKTSPLLVGKTDSELSAMVPILDELVLNYLVGVHSDTLLFSKAKAEEAFKANQTAYKGFRQYKNSNRYYLETHDGKKATGFVLDYEHSPAQKALNAVASANSSVEVESSGVVNNILIRVEHMTTRRSGKRETSKFGKSLMSYEASEGNFWNHYRSWLIKRLDEAGATEAEMKDEETGKFLPGYLLEQGYKQMINSAPNLTEEQKVEAIATIEDTRQQLEAKYKVDPITNSTLSALLSSADIRLPLIKQDFNLAGRKLADEASRDKLNSLVNGRVRKVVPSHVTARLTYTSTVVSPEQPLAQKSIPTSSRS